MMNSLVGIRPRRRRRGFTLAEVLVGSTVATILTAGVGATIYVAGRATSGDTRPAATTVAGAMTAEQIAAELQYAASFTERSPTAVEFTVADRNGDASPETIRYEWSGVAGDPITRAFNGGPAVTVVEGAHQFALDYGVQTITEAQQQEGSGQGAETLLASFEGWEGISFVEQEQALLPSYGITEYAPLNWPDGATELTITRVRVKLRRDSPSAQFTVGIRKGSGGTGPIPEATYVGTPVVGSGAELANASGWVEFSFSDVTLTDPSSGYNLVLLGTTSGAYVSYYYATSAPVDDTVALFTANNGSTWTPSSSFSRKRNDMLFYLYGSPDSSTPQEIEVNRNFVRSVKVALQVGAEATGRAHTTAQLLNSPEIVEP